MPYMAVGSRQILYSDSPAPATTGNSPREVASLRDNETVRSYDPGVNAPEESPADTSPVSENGSVQNGSVQRTAANGSPAVPSGGEGSGHQVDIRV